MNVTTIGFPFGSPAGAPVFGAPDQGFALALGAASSFTAPTLPGIAPQGGMAGALTPSPNGDPGAFARAQPGSALTLSQLLATGSKLPAGDIAVPVAPLATDAPLPVLQDAPAQDLPPLPEIPVIPATPDVASDAAPLRVADVPGNGVAPAPVPASPNPGTATKPDPNEPVACPTATDGQPTPLDLPTATRPTPESVPTSPVATPVKTRKPLLVDRDAAPSPVDPLTAQPAATQPAVTQPAIMPAVVAAPVRKPEGGRGDKTVTVTLNQAEMPAPDTAPSPDAALAKAREATSNAAAPSDTALPAEISAKAEGRAGGATVPTPQQSFASQLTHASAPAPASASVHATAPLAAEPMIPARTGQLGHAMGVEIARKVEAGEDTLRVRLNPVELGRVEVTLAFDDRGNLRATMRAESQYALDLLRQDAPDLGRALDSAGVRADAQSFRFESRGDGNGGAGGQSAQHQSRGGHGQQSFDDESETIAPAYRAIRNEGQVDLLA